MTKSAFPDWIYDGSEIPDPLGHGARAVEFLRRLRHPNSTAPNRAFQLFDWQERIVRRIYGPRHADGTRVVKTVFMLLPRGNRKTSLAAALALLHLFGPEKRPAGQIIFAACDREQASIGFKEAANIVREDKRLIAATSIRDAFNSKKQITYPGNGSTLTAIASDGGAAHGLTPSFTLIDEIHAWKGRDLWEALKSGTAKIDDSLIVIATTAGRGAETLAAEQYDYARRVALGEIDNPEYLPILFAAEPDDDWQDENTWLKANPGLKHGFPSLSGLRALAKEAEHRPAERYAFQQFNLNMWQGASRSPLFDMDTWDARQFDDDDTDLESLPCWIGVDMALSGDTASVVAAWLHDDGQISVKPWFFIPGDDLKGRSERDGVPYQEWADQGLITATPGPIIDAEIVEDHLRELCGTFDVQEIAFDPHLARRMMQGLHDDGLPVVELRQTPLNMGVAIGDLERTVNGEMIRQNGHPVLRHHFDSVVASRSESGLTRMHKGKKTDRIDGAVACAIAVHRASAGETNKSQYSGDDAELFVF
ncbi:terminase large subunit [Oceaniovalibus sp. ACAM 378]|uniref:terminase large subunit n=1 Tax=Oceaniovalibus sp. ACAM 378 TaxID=2599923 RepID=UPI0011D6E3D3|nr:terminase TerL endonuclease subunit [Oceaniovalibus sp. ACAM 378]TYB85529.1 terminase large subunit [Oceaniovalibus sp. ACAM 378]